MRERDLAHEIEVVLDEQDGTCRGPREPPQDAADLRSLRRWSAPPSVRRAAPARGSSASTIASSSACFCPATAAAPACPADRSRPVARTTSHRRLRQRERGGTAPERRPVVRSRARDAQAFGDGERRRRRSRSGTCGRGRARRSDAAAATRGLAERSRTVPLLRSAPSLRQRISVVLPAPFGPTRLSSSPAAARSVDALEHRQAPKCLRDVGHRPAALAPRARVVAAAAGRSDSAATGARPAAAQDQPADGRAQALRQQHDHEDEGEPDQQPPEERQVAREIGAGESMPSAPITGPSSVPRPPSATQITSCVPNRTPACSGATTPL